MTGEQKTEMRRAGLFRLFVAPVVLLYSYTRKPKNERISALIPVVGIVLIIIMTFEGVYHVLNGLSRKVNHLPLRDTIEAVKITLAEMENPPVP